MYARIVSTALAAVVPLLLAAAPARAALVQTETSVDLVFEQIALSGSGPIALGDGWTEVQTELLVSQSASLTSTLNGSIVVTADTENPFLASFEFDLSATLFLDLGFTDVDPINNFGGGLGSSFTLAASAAKPLLVGVNFTVTLPEMFAIAAYQKCGSSAWATDGLGDVVCTGVVIPGATIADAVQACNDGVCAPPEYTALFPIGPIDLDVIDPGLEYALGADLGDTPGGNGFEDAVSFIGADLMFASLDQINVLDPVLTLGAAIDASGVSFSGGIADLVADPPFTIMLDGPIVLAQPVPAPVSAALFALGLAGMAARRGRRRRSR